MEYNLCDYNTVSRLLKQHGFSFSKSLGQNFLIDGEVCPRMAEELCADSETGVIEIGPGIGVLTKELCKRAGKVVSIELDRRLYPLLDETLGDYNNFELVEGDALRLDYEKLIEEKLGGYKKIKVCANLPYYITSPIITYLLESRLSIDEIVVMVQKEAADRLCARLGTREAGVISAAVEYYAEAQELFWVGRENFMPSPKVDSAVIKISLREKPLYELDDEKEFFSLIKAAFSQRRKTLVNSLSATSKYSKNDIVRALSLLSLSESVRAENLTMEDFAQLYRALNE